MKKINTYKLARVGLMAALVLLSTFLRVQIPIGSTNTMLHLGNVACLLSGLLLGPIEGAKAAAVGSFIFDVLNPMYIPSAPFTIVFKFIMVFICGKVAYMDGKNGNDNTYNVIGSILGSMVYVILRTIKSLIINIFFLHMVPATAVLIVAKGTMVSMINSIIAIIAAVTLTEVFKSKTKFLKL